MHYIEYCEKCGTVISQCRCPSLDKEARYGVCAKCKETAIHTHEWTPRQLASRIKRTGEKVVLHECETCRWFDSSGSMEVWMRHCEHCSVRMTDRWQPKEKEKDDDKTI